MPFNIEYQLRATHALSTILISQWLHENALKVELLKNSDGKSSRKLAEKYVVSRTQVQKLMKRKREILDSYEDDANSSRKRQCVYG